MAFATTPIAFAVLGRVAWFKARRGRVMQRPEFSSIVAGMILVMAIPAIFSALVLKSRWFDRNRYEFDPNKTWSVLEQGRGFKSVEEADAAVKREMERLALERKNLVDNVKKLDEAMLALRAAAGTSPTVAQAFPAVLQSLAGVRKSVGVDGPQQLQDFTAPPAELRNLAAGMPLALAPAVASAASGSDGPHSHGQPPQWAGSGPGRSRAGCCPGAPEGHRRHGSPGRPATGLDCGQVRREVHRDLQRRQPLRENRRPRRELPPVRREGDGLYLLPPHRRRV